MDLLIFKAIGDDDWRHSEARGQLWQVDCSGHHRPRPSGSVHASRDLPIDLSTGSLTPALLQMRYKQGLHQRIYSTDGMNENNILRST